MARRRSSAPGVWLALAMAAAGCSRGGKPPRAVVVDYASAPASLDPSVVLEEISYSIQSNVYERLLELDAALAVRPGLAEEWHDEDGGRTWVIHLRQGVRFHDGHEVTARDVIASIERTRAASSRGLAFLGELDQLEAPDGRTVVVRTRVPLLDVPHRLTSAAVFHPAARPGEPPAGTGPYRIVRRMADGTTILKAVPGHRFAVSVKDLEFHVVPDEAERVARIERGDSHVLLDVPAGALERLERNPALRILATRGLRVVFLGMDVRGEAGPLRDPRVRRAIALAVDRAALVSGPLRGHAATIDQVVSPSVAGHDPGLPPLPHDLAEARRLLAEAGLPTGFDVPLELMPAKYRAMPEVARAIAADLLRIGIRVTLRPFPMPEFLSRRETGSGGLYLQGWMTTGWDAGLTYDQLLHTRTGGHGSANGTGYSDPTVDRTIEEAAAEMSPDARIARYNELARRVQADVPLVPLYLQDDMYAVARDLELEPTVTRAIRGAAMRWKR